MRAENSIQKCLGSWEKQTKETLEERAQLNRRFADESTQKAYELIEAARARVGRLLKFDPETLALGELQLKLESEELKALSARYRVPLVLEDEKPIIETRHWETRQWNPNAISMTDSRGDWDVESGVTEDRVGTEFSISLHGAELGAVNFEHSRALNTGSLFAANNLNGDLIYGIRYLEPEFQGHETYRPAYGRVLVIGQLDDLVAWLAEHAR